MSDQTKKISFGFSKLAKKTSIVSTQLTKNNQEDDKSKVEFIDCLEGKSIKLKDPLKLEQGPLIIPLTRTKEEKSQNFNNANTVDQSKCIGLYEELQNKSENTKNDKGKDESNLSAKDIKIEGIKKTDGLTRPETLDEIAAREILEELNKKKADEDDKRVFSVPLTSNAPSGEKESTLEDYENIPVGDFGMAMLRGMGWAPGKGIGKTEKLVAPSLPIPRPKGMGLGADKVIKTAEKKSSNEELKMVKGSFIRVLAGSDKDAYGQVEGFDDESGRLIVKLAIKNVSISLNEFMVQLVDANEFKKNSKVINVSKYEQYKDDEIKKESSEKTLKEENQKNICDRRLPASPYQSEKPKVTKKRRSSSCESEEVQEDKRTEKSKSASYQRSPNRSSRSPNAKKITKERAQSRHHVYELAKPESTSRLSKDKKNHRSKSSDSSSSYSSGNYSNHYKNKHRSTKSKSLFKDRSVSQRSRSSTSSSSDSAENYSKKKKKYKQKKSSSNKYRSRSRSRSRSPKKHKYKKSKKYY